MKKSDIDFIKVASVLVGIATVFVMYMQFKEQKELWDIQKELHALELEQKKANA